MLPEPHGVARQAADASPPWAPIESIAREPVPRFPVSELPAALGQWVEEESRATQTPPDLAAFLALANCSAAIARRVDVEARTGYVEPTNLYGCVILDPANRKSAVFRDAVAPLKELERERIEDSKVVVAQAASQRRRDEARIKRLEQKASGSSDPTDDTAELDALVEEIARRVDPVEPRLIAEDATEEALTILLAEQGGRVASLSCEGGVFDLMAGKYAKNGGASFNLYLKAHPGDDLVSHRVGRPTVYVERPALTCCYAVQQCVVNKLARDPEFRGRGLLARFLYARPLSLVGYRVVGAAPVSPETTERYRQLVRRLAGCGDGVRLTLNTAASHRFMEWEQEVEEMLREGGALEGIEDWGGKLAGATLRLAGVLHCVAHSPAGQIGPEALEGAIAIARYLIPHARSVLCPTLAEDDSAVGDALYILRWIRRHDKRRFSRRDLHQHGRRRFEKADDMDGALTLLCDHNYLRRVVGGHAGSAGRPKSSEYEVNPAVFEPGGGEIGPQNPQKSAAEPLRVRSEDIEDGVLPFNPQKKVEYQI